MQYNRPPDRRPMSAANKLVIFVIVLVIFGAGATSIYLRNRDGRFAANQPEPTAPIVPGIADVQGAVPGLDNVAAASPMPTDIPAVFVTPEPEPTATAEPNFFMTPTPTDIPTLKLNASGEEVRQMQGRLIELGYMREGADDAQYGRGTQNAVKAFQAANGLGADGAAGPKTLSLLFSNQAKAKPE